MKGRLLDLVIGLDGKQRVTIAVEEDLRTLFDDLHDSDVNVEVKRWYKRRSLDANAYCWVLIDKLAEKLNLSKKEVYRELIRSIAGVSETVCTKTIAVERLKETWSRNGLGWFAETYPSKIKDCTNVILYFGSSCYDTKQMSALIDLLVEDCKAQGIETATPEELARLKEGWKP